MKSILFLCIIAIAVITSPVAAKQPIPFDPIHPGSLHADHFSPLNGEGVNVPNFKGSLQSATPVTFNIAGGVKFDNEDFEISGDGPISVISEVNNLNIEALGGQALFQGEDMFIRSLGGDLVFESLRDNVSVETLRGSLDLEGPSISVEGNFHEGGVNLTSDGAMSFTTGSSTQNGNIDFSGRNIIINGADGVLASAQEGADMFFFALDKLEVDSHGPMNLGSTGMLEILSLSGPMNVEAAQVNIQTPDFFYEATGSMTLASALGRVDFTAGSSISARSADQVKFTSNENGVHAQANSDVNYTAGDIIDLSSSISESEATLSSEDILLNSQLDQVQIHANENLVATIGTAMNVNANQDGYLTAQDAFAVTTSGSIMHDIERNLVMSGANQLSFNGNNGNIEFDIDDDMFVVGDILTGVTGEGIAFTVADDADFEIQGDMIIDVTDDLRFTFTRDGTVSGEIELDLASDGVSSMSADDITVTSGDSIDFRANDIQVNTAGGDLTVQSPLLSSYRYQELTMDGTADISVEASASVSFRAESDFEISTTDLEMTSALDTDLYFDALAMVAQNDIEITTTRDLHFFVHDELSFISDRDDSSKTVFTSGDNFRFESGTFAAQGVDLDIDTNAFHIFARRGLSLESGGDFDFDSQDDIDLVADRDFNINAGGTVTFDAEGQFTVSSTDLFHGDIIFRSTEGSIFKQIGDNVDIDADRFEAHGGNSIVFNSETFKVIHGANGPTDFGNVVFSSGKHTQTAGVMTAQGRTVEYSAQGTIRSIAEQTLELASNSNEDVDMFAENNIEITGGRDLFFNSPTVEFFGVESAAVDAEDIILNSTDFDIITSLDISFDGQNDITFDTANDLASVSSDFVSFTAGNIDVNAANTLSVEENGNGSEFNAQSGITFEMANMYSTAGDLISFIARTQKIDLDGVQSINSIGGEHIITSASDYSLSSTNVMNFLSNDNGFTSFVSGNNIDSMAGDFWQLTGATTSLTTTPGRFGTIRSTASDAHICFDSQNVGETAFSGDSVLFTASGPNAALNVTSERLTSFTSTVGSIGMSAYGAFPEDPQFLFEDDVTFGIIYRTAPDNTNGITVNSNLADVAAYADRRFFMSSNTSSLNAQAQGEMDFRTFGMNATINVVTLEGDLSIFFDNTGIFTAGNPLLPADMRINATRDVLMNSAGSTDWTNLGTTTVDDTVGVLIESFDDMSFTTGSSFTVNALDGGIYNLETRKGDTTFTSTNNDIDFRSETGSIAMISRGESTFTSATGDINFEAAGDGGSVFLSSGGEQLFEILAIDTKLFVEADLGEVDFEGTEGFFGTVALSNTYNAPCINIEGGSVKYDADTLIEFNAEEDISFDTDVEFTVDASFINFNAKTTFSMSTGGTGVSPGITADSQGDIRFDSSNGDISFNGTNVIGTTTDNINFEVEQDILVQSTLDSLLQDSITISAQNTGALFQSADLTSTAKLTQTTTSANTNAVIVSAIALTAERELRMDTEGDWVNTIAGGDLRFSGGDIDADFALFDITSTTKSVAVHGDSSVQFDGNAAFPLTSSDFTLTTKGSQAFASIESLTSFTVDGTNKFTSDVDGAHQVFANNAVTLSSTGDFTITSFDDILITAETTLTQQSDADIAVNAEYFLLNSKSFFADNQQDVSFTSTLFEGYSFRDTNLFSAGAMSFVGAAGQFVQFFAEDDITLNSNIFVSNSQDSQRFIASGDDNLVGTDIQATTSFTGTATDFEMIAKRHVNFQFTDFFADVTNVDLESYGAGGIQMRGNAITLTLRDSSSYVTESGNIEIDGSTMSTFGASVGEMNFITHHSHGDIRSTTNGATGTTFTSGDDIFIQQFHPNVASGASSPQSGGGLIRFEALTFQITSGTTFTMNSNDDISVRWSDDVSGSWTGVNVNIEGGLVSDFHGYRGVTIDATSATYSALGSTAAEVRVLSNSVIYSASTIDFNARSEARFVSSGTIEVSSSDSLTVNSVLDIRMTAQRDDFIIASATDQFTLSGDLMVTATGTEGVLSIDATASLQPTTGSVYMTADNSIHAPFNQFLPGQDLRVHSAHDIVLLGKNSINVVGDDIDLQATNDGVFTIESGGPIMATALDFFFEAQGMLGTIGGRYVLEDSYWFNVVTLDEHHRINRNTNGIEVTNVNGNVNVRADDRLFIVSCQGSIEFRATEVIQYSVPNTAFIYFFGINPPDFSGPASPPGEHKLVPIDFSNDYCSITTCSASANCVRYSQGCGTRTCSVDCSEISQVLNDIVSAMVAYGLLACSAGSGFCFTP